MYNVYALVVHAVACSVYALSMLVMWIIIKDRSKLKSNLKSARAELNRLRATNRLLRYNVVRRCQFRFRNERNNNNYRIRGGG
jgi:uncharacterized membrane protein